MSEYKLRPLVYIAGPIRKGNLDSNIAQAFDAFYALKNAGFSPVCPHLSCFLETGAKYRRGNRDCWYARTEVYGVTFEEWMEIDLSILAKCDYLFRLPGESEGADKEVEFATKNGILVYVASDDFDLDARQLSSLAPIGGVNRKDASRSAILEQASKCVNGPRDQQYGSPEDNFSRIADLWNAYLRSNGMIQPGCPGCLGLHPHEVAALLALVKIARSIESPEHLDNWIDLAGYAACGGEVASRRMTK